MSVVPDPRAHASFIYFRACKSCKQAALLVLSMRCLDACSLLSTKIKVVNVEIIYKCKQCFHLKGKM
jgi:hypothetical protein